MTDALISIAISALVPAFIWWTISLGKPPPNAAIYPPALKVMCLLLPAVFIAFAITMALGRAYSACFGMLLAAIAFGVFAVDAFYYRLTWDSDGFAVRRLFGGSFAVNWGQVMSWSRDPSNVFQFQLRDDAAAQRFSFSTIALGGREFIATAERHIKTRYES
ncbi:MAG: hypothetical protein HY054_14075 [Proteobacteria bacterium]|nr:hypothetical protein [Pseudomonadota bacterium]